MHDPVYLTCAFSIATSTEDSLSEAEPIRLHIPLALSLWSDLDLRKIYLDWVLGKKLQPWLLGEHQSNSLLPSPQVPILYKKLTRGCLEPASQACGLGCIVGPQWWFWKCVFLGHHVDNEVTTKVPRASLGDQLLEVISVTSKPRLCRLRRD